MNKPKKYYLKPRDPKTAHLYLSLDGDKLVASKREANWWDEPPKLFLPMFRIVYAELDAEDEFCGVGTVMGAISGHLPLKVYEEKFKSMHFSFCGRDNVPIGLLLSEKAHLLVVVPPEASKECVYVLVCDGMLSMRGSFKHDDEDAHRKLATMLHSFVVDGPQGPPPREPCVGGMSGAMGHEENRLVGYVIRDLAGQYLGKGRLSKPLRREARVYEPTIVGREDAKQAAQSIGGRVVRIVRKTWVIDKVFG